jgi:serine/threonine protein kinase
VAIKILPMDTYSEQSRQILASEWLAMNTADHPNVIKLFQVIDAVRVVYLVMEYAAWGSLSDVMLMKGKLSESDAVTAFVQISDGIKHLHDNLIVHRDLKPDNIFINDHGEAKIGDFGFSVRRRYWPRCHHVGGEGWTLASVPLSCACSGRTHPQHADPSPSSSSPRPLHTARSCWMIRSKN